MHVPFSITISARNGLVRICAGVCLFPPLFRTHALTLSRLKSVSLRLLIPFHSLTPMTLTAVTYMGETHVNKRDNVRTGKIERKFGS